MTMNEIRFENLAQVVLYECELKGQISDGHWEDDDTDHWKVMCDAKATVAEKENEVGLNFTPEREYDFCEVVDVLSDRMIRYVKICYSMPEHVLKFNSHWSWDKNIGPDEERMIDAIEYTEDDLIEDLSSMRELVNKAYQAGQG